MENVVKITPPGREAREHASAGEMLSFRFQELEDAIEAQPKFRSSAENQIVARNFGLWIEGLVERGLMSRAEIGAAMGGPSTTRIYKYSLDTSPPSDAQLRALVRSARAYARQIANIARYANERSADSAAGFVDAREGLAAVFSHTDYSPQGAIDDGDDHLLRTQELLRNLALHVGRAVDWPRLDALMQRHHMLFDVASGDVLTGSHASSDLSAMEHSPLFDFWGPHLEDLQPLPAALLYTVSVSPRVRGRLQLSNRPRKAEEWSARPEPGVICVPATAQTVLEVWLCIGRVTGEPNSVGPALHERFALRVEIDEEDPEGSRSFALRSGMALRPTSDESLIEPVYVSALSEHGGMAGPFAEFHAEIAADTADLLAPQPFDEGIGRNGTTELGKHYSAHWWALYREISRETLTAYLGVDSRAVRHTLAEPDPPRGRQHTTWQAGTIGALIEHDLGGASAGQIETQLISSARELKAKIERASESARAFADAHASEAITRWRRNPKAP